MFEAKQFSHTQTLILNGPIERVFPLFGPVLEKEWAAGWNPTIISAGSPLADHAGAIFTSSHPGEPDTVWYVNRFDGGKHTIEYLRITPGKQFVVVEIICEALDDNRTQAAVAYRFTALSEAGNAVFDQLTQHHPIMVQHWEQAINHYLQGGDWLSDICASSGIMRPH
jgi:hypothetical protein